MGWLSPEIAVIIAAGAVNAGLVAASLYIRSLVQKESVHQRQWIKEQNYATKDYVKAELELLRVESRNEALGLRNALLEREIQAVKDKSTRRLLDVEGE